VTAAVAALQAYRKQLIQRGQPLKAETVAYCITILRRLAR